MHDGLRPALRRKRRTVVVAIRGTSSLADMVTDAVVHPEAIDDWLPPGREQARPAPVLVRAGAHGRACCGVVQWTAQARPLCCSLQLVLAFQQSHVLRSRRQPGAQDMQHHELCTDCD